MLLAVAWLYVMASSAVHMDVPREPTQLSILNWSLNEYQLQLGVIDPRLESTVGLEFPS